MGSHGADRRSEGISEGHKCSEGIRLGHVMWPGGSHLRLGTRKGFSEEVKHEQDTLERHLDSEQGGRTTEEVKWLPSGHTAGGG